MSVARSSHRLFDVRWLRSKAARFELVGLVNRLDRAGIIGGCGEIRLVYRLAYTTESKGSAIASRLPMTLSLELTSRGGEAPAAVSGALCRDAALRWYPPKGNREGAALARWLVSEAGPLFGAQRHPSTLRRAAVNMQSVRWPSTVRPISAVTPNTCCAPSPTTARAGWLPFRWRTRSTSRGSGGARPLSQAARMGQRREQPSRDRRGHHRLARRAQRATRRLRHPRGISRGKNRPFSTVLRETDLSNLDFSTTENAKWPAALLRRLDDLTCPGCHESRSVAGFHFLGVDREGTTASDALASPFSPHFARDQPRGARSCGRSVIDEHLPMRGLSPSMRSTAIPAMALIAVSAMPALRIGPVMPAYRCDRFDTPENDVTVGACLPEHGGGAGDPCEIGRITPSPRPFARSRHPDADRAV